MYEIYQGISHPGCIPAYPGYGYMHRDLYETITSSHLTLQTKQGRIKNFKLSGVTRQVETTGAQLFDAGTAKDSYYIKDDTGEESTTATQKDKFASDYIPVSGIESITFNAETAWGAWYDASKLYISGFGSSGAGRTLVVPENAAYMRFTGNIENKNVIMLNAGETALPWEPYTGATSSPSPEYPQDIQGVGKRTKNLFDKDAWYDFFYDKEQDIYWVDDDHTTLRWRGSSGYDAANDTYYEFPIAKDVPENTWVTLSFDGRKTVLSENQETGIRIRQNGVTTGFASMLAEDGTDWVHKFVSVKVSGNLTLTMTYNSNGYCEFKNIQIELSDHETPYEPYGYRTDVVTRSKNLADISGAKPYTGTTAYQKIPGGFVLDASTEGHRVAVIPCSLKSGVNYVCKCRCIYKTPGELVKVYLPEIRQYLTPARDGDNLSCAFVPTEDVKQLGFYFSVDAIGTGVEAEITELQVEEGNTPTPYQPYAYYTAPIYTREPVYQGDKIQLVDGQYCHISSNIKYVFTGNEMPVLSISDYGHIFTFSIPGAMYEPGKICARSNCFVGVDFENRTNSGYERTYVDYAGNVVLRNSAAQEFPNVQAMQDFLKARYDAGNPVYVVFAAEPQTEPLPAISQQALRNLPTYKGTTIIGTTDPLEPEITVLYRAAKKNFFNFDKVFNNPVEATGYFKYDLGLSPGNYVWSLQKNEFLGSDNQFVLITDDLGYDGSGITSGEIYQWIGHSTLANSCSTSGTFTITDEMYITVHGGNVDAVKPLLKTLRIEKA